MRYRPTETEYAYLLTARKTPRNLTMLPAVAPPARKAPRRRTRLTQAQYVEEMTQAAPSYDEVARRQRISRAHRRKKKHPLTGFLRDLTLLKLPAPELEYEFHPTRKWRLDVAFPAQKVAIEYQGIFGEETASHASVSGLMRDYRKFTEVSLAGWILVLVDAKSIETGEAHEWVQRALSSRSPVRPAKRGPRK